MAKSFSSISCVTLTEIEGTDCIGDSRSIINTNTENLGTALCTLSSITNTLNASDTSTVDLTWTSNTRTLKADVIDGSITGQKMSGNQTGSAPVYGCRAWVNFDGSRNAAGTPDTTNTDRYIRASGNVSSVLRNGQGDYTITFTIPMQDANYCLTGVSRPQNGLNNPSIFAPFVSSNTTTFTHVNPTLSSARVVSGQSAAGGTWDSDYVMVTIFR